VAAHRVEAEVGVGGRRRREAGAGHVDAALVADDHAEVAPLLQERGGGRRDGRREKRGEMRETRIDERGERGNVRWRHRRGERGGGGEDR
tara:strand:- start:1409 stop:1678 length:270 start_codon:yes stop_codon:yes gene_type:complete